jgi:hypothetical protein
MTQTRSWLALGALLAAIVGGTVWAQQKKAAPPAYPQGETFFESDSVTAKDKKCCDEKCETKEAVKSCCEGKCCAAEKTKACCADGKCCGCCEKAKDKTQVMTVPVPPGAAVQVMVEPVGAGQAAYEMPPVPAPPVPAPYVAAPPMPGCGSSWCPAQTFPNPQPPQVATPMSCPALPQGVAPPCDVPPPPLPPQAAQYRPVSGVSTVTGTACTILAPLPPQSVSPWLLRVVELNHHSRLMMQFDGDKDTPRVSCEEMVLHVGPEPLTVSVEGKQVHLSGNFIKGSADTIGRNAANGNLVMEGHVKLNYGKEGKKVEVTADQVVVNITEGRVEVSGLGRAAWTPLTTPKQGEVRPTTTTPTNCPLCPASSDEAHQVFNFWTGFFR